MLDREIINLFIRRDERAIKETKLKYGKYVRLCIGRIVEIKEDIEECENDTYLKAWNSVHKIQPVHLPAYLCRIAYHEALGKLGYYSAEKRCGETTDFNLEPEIMYYKNLCEYKVTEVLIDEFIDGFSTEKKEVFRLRFYEGASYEDISSEMGFSIGKTAMMVKRMKEKLKNHLIENDIYI